MANLSLRGLDASTLTRIKSSARRRKVSVNRLIIETLQQHYATGEQTFDDLDTLAGSWSKSDAEEFSAAIAPFEEIDAHLWAQQRKAVYQVKPAATRKSRK